MGKLQESVSAEEDGAFSKSAIALSSSDDDEEANKDLSLAIVERARQRDSNRKRASNGDLVVVLSDSSDGVDIVANRTADGREKTKKKTKTKERVKKKTKTKKKAGDGEEIKDASVSHNELYCEVEAVPNEEEPSRAAYPVVTEVNGKSDNVILKKLLRGSRYFDPGNKNLEACFNCGEEGHIAVDCTEERRKRPCFVCGMFGHNAKHCTQGQDCFICRRRGHIAKNCPDKHKSTSPDSIICLRCGDVGHDMLSCNNDYAPEDLKGIQCYICKNFGHLCCADIIVSSTREVSCYNCAQPGHTGLGCAKLRGESNELCYKCGEEGHFARGCTYLTKVSSETNDLCYKCGEEGHFARACTNYAKFDRWEGGSSSQRFTNEHRDSQGSQSVPRCVGRAHKKSLSYDGRNKSAGKSSINGGWTVDDPGDLPKRKHKTNGWNSPSTPVGRNNGFYSSASIDNYSSSQMPFNKHKSFSGTPKNHRGYDPQRYRKSHGFYERT